VSDGQRIAALTSERDSHRLIEQGHAFRGATLLNERAAHCGHRQQLKIGVPIGPAYGQRLTGQPLAFQRVVGNECSRTEQLTPQLRGLGLDNPRRTRQPATSRRHVPHELLVIADQGQCGGGGQHLTGRIGTLLP
jgi:hypothetical protein